MSRKFSGGNMPVKWAISFIKFRIFLAGGVFSAIPILSPSGVISVPIDLHRIQIDENTAPAKFESP